MKRSSSSQAPPRAWAKRLPLHLAAAGAAVSLGARSGEGIAAAAEEVRQRGGTALAVTADVAHQASCEELVAATLSRFGRLDALVNNAGILSPMAPIAEADPQAWQYNLAVNMLGPFYLVRAGLQALRHSRGRIVNVSTGAARHPIEGCSAYCAAKAALTHFTTVLAAEERDVTAVAVRPGVVDTAMQDQIRNEGAKVMPAQRFQYFSSLKAAGSLEPPEVPARSIAWLALHCPPEWSGDFLEYDDPRIAGPAESLFP